MRVLMGLFLLFAVAVMPLQGCSSSKEMATSNTSACEMCTKGKAGEAVWCEGCEAGYVDAQKISCKGCFTAKSTGTACTSCQGE